MSKDKNGLNILQLYCVKKYTHGANICRWENSSMEKIFFFRFTIEEFRLRRIGKVSLSIHGIIPSDWIDTWIDSIRWFLRSMVLIAL